MAEAKKHDEENLKENDVENLKQEDVENKEKNEASDSEDEKVNDKVSEKETDEIIDEKESSQEEIENLNNRLLRLQADFLNYKARTEKEKISTYNNAVSALILELLPVVDNFERALSIEKPEGNSFKEGIQMVYDQLMGIFEKNGLKEIEALHKPFDHNIHYAVGFEESEEYDDGIIIDVLQKGYTVNDKCIRPSMVRICKK